MSASNQVFLYIEGNRTLWIPLHKASAHETSPVYVLNFVTPMELSRSFYLFDYPIQLVDNRQLAAMSPNAKTPQDVVAAVNDFRRVCVEDQSFLLQRCYDPTRTPAQQQPQPQQQPPQPQQPIQIPMPQRPQQQAPHMFINPNNDMGVVGAAPANSLPVVGGGGTDNLLSQLLQRQSNRQQQQPMMPSSLVNPGMGTDMYGGGGGNNMNRNMMGGNTGMQGNNAFGNPLPGMMGTNNSNHAMVGGPGSFIQPPNMGSNPSQIMIGGNYGGEMQSDPFRQQGGIPNAMMYGGGRNGRRHFNNSNFMGSMSPYGQGGAAVNLMGLLGGNNAPSMTVGMQGQPMMGGGGHDLMQMGQQQHGMPHASGPFSGEARRDPEPIQIDVVIPDEVLRTYMNPTQPIVCATMPGPRMTVWLREYPLPDPQKSSGKDNHFVFCKGGIVLMLKAKGSEVEKSKPVELFPKQICTHFLIYGFCSRNNCLHEHHSEEQIRRLIAARHVQLKAMTKKERHQLVEDILRKEKEGIQKAEEDRLERTKEREAAHATRRASHQSKNTNNGNQAPTPNADPAGILSDDAILGAENAVAASATVNTAISDDEGDSDEDTKVASPAKSTTAGTASSHHSRSTGALPPSNKRRKDGRDLKLNAAKLASLGVATDSDDEMSSSSSSSSRSSSSSDDEKVEPEVPSKATEPETVQGADDKQGTADKKEPSTRRPSVSPARAPAPEEDVATEEHDAEEDHKSTNEEDGEAVEDESDDKKTSSKLGFKKAPAAKKRGRTAAAAAKPSKRAKK